MTSWLIGNKQSEGLWILCFISWKGYSNVSQKTCRWMTDIVKIPTNNMIKMGEITDVEIYRLKIIFCHMTWSVQVSHRAVGVRTMHGLGTDLIWNLTIWLAEIRNHANLCAYRIMTSSNQNSFRVTGHLCGEFTGQRWIPLTKASDAELWCFRSSVPWINGWVNNRAAGDLRRHRCHNDVIVMVVEYFANGRRD